MPRPKGSKNREIQPVWTMNLSTPERIDLIANIMVDKIIEDQKNGGPLLKKIRAPKPLYMLRVFTNEQGGSGDKASVVLDDGQYIPSDDRPGIARQLDTGETIFVNDLASGKISIVHPQGEIAFAGTGAIAVVWLIAKLRGTPVDSLVLRDGKTINVRQDGDITWAQAPLDIMPPWHLQQFASPEEVEHLDVDTMKDTEHTMVWAWQDEAKGLVRARTFAADWDIPEAQGNGSGSMMLAAQLGREIEIHHGRGSVIFARPEPENQAAVGGRVTEDKRTKLKVSKTKAL